MWNPFLLRYKTNEGYSEIGLTREITKEEQLLLMEMLGAAASKLYNNNTGKIIREL